ncbi:hypothetical protein Lser_V15G09919 [Lactuca serriola]
MLDGATKLSKQLLGDNLGGGSVRIQPQDVVRPAKRSKPPVNEDDTEFLQNKERLLNLEKKLSSASKQ